MSAQVGNRWVEQLRRVRDKPPIKIAKRLSPAAPRLKSIKKVLFPPDDDDVQCPNQICNTQLRLQQEAQQKKWNFDFAQGKPMKGAYQWKLVNGTGAETIETKPTPKLKQQQILDMFKKRKRVPSSTDTAEGISAKKVRMMAASSSTSPDNAPPQQQQQEASTSSAN